ncbi:MAG TPA: hypothetical protein VHO02_02200 [Fibrobacteria bacterium]|nr:hypothetical protein [Fibrobacteria bacterium]
MLAFAVGPALSAESPSTAMPVRYSEGVVHGFLTLSDLNGKVLAKGELLQTAKDGDVQGRMVFHFNDGSLSEETTVFTQRGVFSLQSYHQVQRGPAFPRDLDFKVTRTSATTGTYQVTTKPRDEKADSETGKLDLPPDASNGLVIPSVKNLSPGKGRTLHLVALAPGPKVIELEINPLGEEKITHGNSKETVIRYALHPKLGALLGTAAKVIGKYPPDQHLWMANQDAPGFVKFEGSMYNDGPVWRISLAAPCMTGDAKSCVE